MRTSGAEFAVRNPVLPKPCAPRATLILAFFNRVAAYKQGTIWRCGAVSDVQEATTVRGGSLERHKEGREVVNWFRAQDLSVARIWLLRLFQQCLLSSSALRSSMCEKTIFAVVDVEEACGVYAKTVHRPFLG